MYFLSDNLLLSSIDGSSSSVLAVNYHLTKMLIQGQCFDEKMQPVPGLQLELKNHSHVFDATIAMQTLGYWQLKGMVTSNPSRDTFDFVP